MPADAAKTARVPNPTKNALNAYHSVEAIAPMQRYSSRQLKRNRQVTVQTVITNTASWTDPRNSGPESDTSTRAKLDNLTPSAITEDPTEDPEEPTIGELPAPLPTTTANFHWGDIDGPTFTHLVDQCYNETIHWRRNLFKVPSGRAGKSFTRELTRMFQAFADGSALENIAMKTAMIMPALLLQKTHSRSKAKDHTTHLERRLELWKEGNLNELMEEGCTIQHQFNNRNRNLDKTTEQTARIFAKLMMEGKVKAALRLISHENKNSPLKLGSQISETETVREILMKKHPPQQPAKVSSIVTEDMQSTEPHPVIFDKIDGQFIRRTVLRMDGAAGPSGLDTDSWKRLCTSFGSASADLCEALAATARRLCTTFVNPKGLSAFVACRLIALDKCPGVRPIGIGETARHIIGKAIVTALGDNIQSAAGPLQVCAGHQSGCEAAIHAMKQIFESQDTDAVLLVDASNAFNALNRQVALRNILKLCPSLAKILINTYREDIQLFIDGETLLSQEGTTQGDPLAMAMYAIAITPLIHHLENNSVKQAWYANNATAGGNINNLKTWWDDIEKTGPDYGYHPNASKTWLIVKENHLEAAKAAFRGTEVQITIKGKRYLGAAIGTASFVESYVQKKVSGWIEEVKHLSSIAVTQPHAAYAAFTHGLASRWTYLSRTIPNIEDMMKPLETTIRQHFLPSLTGQNPFNDQYRDLLALPARLGGIGITNPSKQTTSHFDASKKITAPLVALITQQSYSYPFEAKAKQARAKRNIHILHRQQDETVAADLKSTLSSKPKRAMEASSEKGASSWLSTLPIAEHGFALHKGEFRDALCLRYGWRPPRLPSHCICSNQFTVQHAINCPRGGFPSIRHHR